MNSRKKNVAFFAISTELGGAETSLLHFLTDRKQKGLMSPTVFVTKPSGPLVDALCKLSIPIKNLSAPPRLLSLSRKRPLEFLLWSLPAIFLSLGLLLKIYRLTKTKQYESFHSTGLKFHLLLGLLCLFTGQKIVLHIRDIFKSKLIKKIFHFFSSFKNIHFVANSKATQAALLPTPSRLSYNGFDSSMFTSDRNNLQRKHFDLPESGIVIGLVGVIARWKGQREFLQMAKNLCSQSELTAFWIVGSEIYDTSGEDGELAFLKRWVVENNLQSRIHFSPFQNPVQPVYTNIDVLVHASVQPEPFGRVLVEAMMSGVPVVAADQGGPLEIVKDGENGFLYEMGNVEDMSQKVLALVENAEMRLNMGRKAPLVAKNFDSQKIHEDLEALLLAP